MLVQTPDINSSEFKYYKDSFDALVLKPGHDFPNEIVNGMDYDTFARKVLNQIGNLRIYYKDKILEGKTVLFVYRNIMILIHIVI